MLVVAAVLVQTSIGSPVEHVPGANTAAGSTQHAGGWPTGAAVAAENAKPGTADWQLTGYATGSIEGWADRVSVRPGKAVQLYVSTPAASFTVQAFRMGWYGGDRARLVWSSGVVPGVQQPDSTLARDTNTVSAAGWSPSLRVDTTGWPPGDYLLRLSSSKGHQSYVPLTVLSPSTRGAVVLVNAVTTWQAYNAWGDYSLYRGARGDADYEHRSVAVSFDRPYGFGGGSADFLGNELPVVALAEKLGLPVAYVTDVDLHADPALLAGARAVVSLGHDEYWSLRMRQAVTAARDGGTNLAFLGANAIYRHIRFAGSTVGPNRLEVDYKDGVRDPLYATDRSSATFDWRDGPDPRPESVLTGTFYQCNPVHADMVVADTDNWLLSDTGLSVGDQLTGLVGSEYDRVDPRVRTPRPIQILFHSPVTCGGAHDYADAAYYSTSSGAGVFDSGTSSWVCALDDACNGRSGGGTAQRAVRTVTTTLLKAFAAGPTGAAHPAQDNVAMVTDLPGPGESVRPPSRDESSPAPADASPTRTHQSGPATRPTQTYLPRPTTTSEPEPTESGAVPSRTPSATPSPSRTSHSGSPLPPVLPKPR